MDGGGIRGVFPAQVLAKVEEKLGVALYEKFDLFAGTSTGAIVAAGIASRMRASDIVELYRERGREIFRRKRRTRLVQAFASKYPSAQLLGVLQEGFGDTTMAEIDKPLMLPAADIVNGKAYVSKSPYVESYNRDGEVLLWKAVAGSCAAPLKFAPFSVKNYLLADGGLWANNPALAAVVEARRYLGASLGDVRVLTFGTGCPRVEYKASKAGWGWFWGWEVEKLANLAISFQTRSTKNYVEFLLDPQQVLRVDTQSAERIEDDDWPRIDDFVSKADDWYDRNYAKINEWFKGELA